MTVSALEYNALAMLILCFCPPLRLIPWNTQIISIFIFQYIHLFVDLSTFMKIIIDISSVLLLMLSLRL